MPTIATEIFKKTFSTTPSIISAPIEMLCHELSQGHQPTWVSVQPDPHAIVNECFNNVANKVKHEGGSVLFDGQFGSGRSYSSKPSITPFGAKMANLSTSLLTSMESG